MPPSKLIVTNICPPKVFFLLGGVNYLGGEIIIDTIVATAIVIAIGIGSIVCT